MKTPARLAAAAALGISVLASVPARAGDESSETAQLVRELGLHESEVAVRDLPGWAPPRKVVLMGADAARVAWMQPVAPGVKLVAAPERADAVREAADADVVIGECVPEVIVWEVKGRTMLVVGLGGIGTEVAKRANALGMTVLATRNSGTEGPSYVAEVGLPDKLLPFAARSDVIVDTLPLTQETKGLIDRRFFDAAKRGALFINVGRGGTVVTPDLVAALKDGRLGGAGLDVTDPEPLPPDHPLWHAPNVLITPHVSASLEGNETPRWILAKENLRRYVAGDKLLSEVDVAKGY